MNEDRKIDVFNVLSSVDVSNYVRGKNGYKYLSWAHAVSALQSKFPKAEIIIKRFDGLPYLKTEVGFFVEVEIIIEGVSRSQLHPVLDFRNKAIAKPTAFEINTSIQRSLAKTIALHGLGLNIYAGEDLPMSESEALKDAKEELRVLLKGANKLSAAAEASLLKMNYDQVKMKIDEYRIKPNSNKGEL
jgi:hypothetical protein